MIYLMRHGEPANDGVRRFIGSSDIPLNLNGKMQSMALKTVFSSVSLDAIYASDLSRCVETAKIIAGDAHPPPRFVSDLREIRLGALEGLSMEEFKFRNPDLWKKRGRQISLFTPEGGESFCDLQNRTVPLFDAICKRHGGHILIITHAGVIRCILCHILDISLENMFRIAPSYAGINLLESFKGTYRLLGLNLNTLP